MILCLELFCYTLTLCHLLNQPGTHFFCLFVNISKVTIQFATELQAGEKNPLVFSQIIQVPLPPYTDSNLILIRQFQAGNVIVALQFVPKTVAFIVFVLFNKILASLKSCAIIITKRRNVGKCARKYVSLQPDFKCEI